MVAMTTVLHKDLWRHMALRSDHYDDDHHDDQDDEDDDGLAQRLVVTYGARGGIQRDRSCTAFLA